MAATKEYGKAQFSYDESQDGYICSEGHLLRIYHHRKGYTPETDLKRYRSYEACSNCPVREKCSNGKKGRTIQDRPFQRIADEVDRRTEQCTKFVSKRLSILGGQLAGSHITRSTR
jgi:hypothetical protein